MARFDAKVTNEDSEMHDKTGTVLGPVDLSGIPGVEPGEYHKVRFIDDSGNRTEQVFEISDLEMVQTVRSAKTALADAGEVHVPIRLEKDGETRIEYLKATKSSLSDILTNADDDEILEFSMSNGKMEL